MNTTKLKVTAQAKRILEQLQINNKITTMQCRDDFSIMHPAARVKELRDQGWPIGLNFYQQIDASGKQHRAGQYYLQVEKLTPEQLNILN